MATPEASNTMRFDAKTILAITGLISVLFGGVELRLKIQSMDDRLTRIEAEVRGVSVAQVQD